MKILEKIPVGLLGATGAVGQRFISLLYDHPIFEIEILAASASSSGERYKDVVNWKLEDEIPEKIGEKNVEALDFEIFRKNKIKVIFSALPANIAKDVEDNLAALGHNVFSNASTHRMDNDVPLLIADVNPNHLDLVKQQNRWPGFIVTNPNCVVCGLATALSPLNFAFGIKNVNVTTFQALSGAGYPGVSSMDITGNVLPYIAGEEEKVEVECQKILGNLTDNEIKPSKFEVMASCSRVSVRNGHLESVVVELENDVSLAHIKSVFCDFNQIKDMNLPTQPEHSIIVSSKEDRPQPGFDLLNGNPSRAKGMAVTVGRIKKKGLKVRFYLLVHNTIRGAAGCSILNAELAHAKGLL